MRVCAKRVDLQNDREALLSVLQRNLPVVDHQRRFTWLYCNNPAGTAFSWFACDASTGQILGAASVFPRFMWVGDTTYICGQVGDFAVDVAARSLGPAMVLQRATLEPVDAGVLTLCYDCPPHDLGMATFHRLNLKPNCQTYRFARPLRTAKQFAKLLGRGAIATGLGSVADLVMRLRISRHKTAREVEVSMHADSFGDEFTVLDQGISARHGVRARRAAEDLNWRYRLNPVQSYTVLVARLHGELCGYAVLWLSADDAYIVDLFGRDLQNTGTVLLEAAADHARDRQMHTLYAVVSEGAGLYPLLTSAGFRRRAPAASVVAYAARTDGLQDMLSHPLHWQFRQFELLA